MITADNHVKTVKMWNIFLSTARKPCEYFKVDIMYKSSCIWEGVKFTTYIQHRPEEKKVAAGNENKCCHYMDVETVDYTVDRWLEHELDRDEMT